MSVLAIQHHKNLILKSNILLIPKNISIKIHTWLQASFEELTKINIKTNTGFSYAIFDMYDNLMIIAIKNPKVVPSTLEEKRIFKAIELQLHSSEFSLDLLDEKLKINDFDCDESKFIQLETLSIFMHYTIKFFDFQANIDHLKRKEEELLQQVNNIRKNINKYKMILSTYEKNK
jgi:hypothetical protein